MRIWIARLAIRWIRSISCVQSQTSSPLMNWKTALKEFAWSYRSLLYRSGFWTYWTMGSYQPTSEDCLWKLSHRVHDVWVFWQLEGFSCHSSWYTFYPSSRIRVVLSQLVAVQARYRTQATCREASTDILEAGLRSLGARSRRVCLSHQTTPTVNAGQWHRLPFALWNQRLDLSFEWHRAHRMSCKSLRLYHLVSTRQDCALWRVESKSCCCHFLFKLAWIQSLRISLGL